MSIRYGEPFEINLVWSERTLTVEPDQTALEVLLAAEVPIDPGCGVGGCGQCATHYVQGEVQHKDACLTPDERETHFCPCVSRARGTLHLPF